MRTDPFVRRDSREEYALTGRAGRQVFEEPEPSASVHKLDSVNDFVHDEEAVSARRSLRRSVDALRRRKAPPLVPYFGDEPRAVQPALHRQRRAASVFDAVSQCLAGSKLEADQIVAGEPVRGKLRDECARLPRAGRRARKTAGKPWSAAHELDFSPAVESLVPGEAAQPRCRPPCVGFGRR